MISTPFPLEFRVKKNAQRTYRPTDRPTDRPSYRDAWTHLKIVLNGLMVQEKALEFATATELVESFIYFVCQLFNEKHSLGENHNSAGYTELNLEFILINYC